MRLSALKIQVCNKSSSTQAHAWKNQLFYSSECQKSSQFTVYGEAIGFASLVSKIQDHHQYVRFRHLVNHFVLNLPNRH